MDDNDLKKTLPLRYPVPIFILGFSILLGYIHKALKERKKVTRIPGGAGRRPWAPPCTGRCSHDVSRIFIEDGGLGAVGKWWEWAARGVWMGEWSWGDEFPSSIKLDIFKHVVRVADGVLRGVAVEALVVFATGVGK